MKHVTKSSQNNHKNGSKDTAKESNNRGSNRHSSKAPQTSQTRSQANITKRRTTESPKSNLQHSEAHKKPISSSKKTVHSSQSSSSETIDSKTIAKKTNVSSKTNTVEGEKLQKVLARSGIGSRREIETMISDGRISVDGKLATLGDRVTVTQNLKIRVDGHIISLKTPEQTICRVIAYYKPEGEICTRNDPEGRPTVYSRLPKIVNGRWIAVGRLDINTSGLLLFTNDGELANRLMHPSNQIEREYSVRVFGEVTDDIKRTVTTSVQLEDGPASFKRMVEAGGEGINKWYNVVLTEGRNREVRRIWEAVDLQVSRLIRIRYGDIQLPNRLPRGGWEELDLTSVNYLRELVQLPSETGTKLNLQKDKKRIKTGQIRRAVQRHTTAASNNRRRRTGL